MMFRENTFEGREALNNEEGYLKVVVSTANGALPIENARVVIRGEDGRELVLFTNESGATEAVALSAPARSSSQSAGNQKPFSTYRVTVEKEGFYPHLTGIVPIFSGVSARQSINLIGLAEYGADTVIPESADTVMRDPQVLNGGGK